MTDFEYSGGAHIVGRLSNLAAQLHLQLSSRPTLFDQRSFINTPTERQQPDAPTETAPNTISIRPERGLSIGQPWLGRAPMTVPTRMRAPIAL